MPMASYDHLFQKLEEQFLLDKNQMAPIVKGFIAEYQSGLKTPSKGVASMIPSFVTALPTGNETGTFLSLDLGGTNLRVNAVELLGNGEVNIMENKRLATTELKHGTGEAFFDWIADTIQELVTEKAPHLFSADQVSGKETLALGVCWSFPVDQTALDKGTVLKMGKGFVMSNVLGRDLADLFHEAFARKNMNVRVCALLNDTVGTLVAHAYANPRTRIGFIYATGCNAAYPEKVANIGKWDEQFRSQFNPDDEMLINTEIDIFGDDTYLPRTKYDLELCQNHSQPDFQPWEKMMSGAYLGELTRLVGLDFIKQGALFDGVVPAGWDKPWSFQTVLMSSIERDNTETRQKSAELLQATFDFASKPTKEDIQVITRICRIVSTRGAIMVAIAIASMIEKQQLHTKDSSSIVIGLNGSTYEFYPYMDDRVHKALRTWFGVEISERIRIEIAREGGSIGGALIAMLAK
ncbi:hypothetical protein VKS41_002304 [Umbelopsis sp. WA50703]